MSNRGSLKKADDINQQDMGSELMLYNGKKDEVHILNGTAKIIWEGIAAGQTEEELEKGLRDRFSIDGDYDIMADVKKVIKEYKNKGLIKQYSTV